MVAGAHVSFGDITIGTFTATTDASGAYSLMVPGRYELGVYVDGEWITAVTLEDRIYRGDFYVHGQQCVARYGTVIDSETGFPVFGAIVSVAATRTTTDGTGWFRLNIGCDPPMIGSPMGPGCVGSNTTFATVTHPDYRAGSFVVGRGICSVQRVDWELQRR